LRRPAGRRAARRAVQCSCDRRAHARRGPRRDPPRGRDCYKERSVITLKSYVAGRWVAGTEKPATLANPSSEEVVAEASSTGVDFRAAHAHALERGGPALGAMGFAQRGEMLRALAKALHAHRDELIELAITNGGNTRGDAKFDIDGASGT